MDSSPAPRHVPGAAALLEQLPDAVYLIDPHSSDIVWCNRLAWA